MKKKIAVCANGWSLEALADALKGFKAYAEKEDFDIFVFIGFASYSVHRTLMQGELNIYKLCDPADYDGVVVFSTMLNSDETVKEIVADATEKNVPIVSFGMNIDGIPSITIGNATGIRTLITHLIEDHGVKDIAFMGGTEDHVDSRERLEVTREVMAEHGLKLKDRDVVYGKWSNRRTIEALDQLLKGRKKLPEAIICANDVMALAVCTELEKRGVDVPGQVKVTGFDNIDSGKIFFPALTTVKQDFETVAKKACEIIYGKPCSKKKPPRIVVPTIPVIAESCGCQNIEYGMMRRTYCRQSFQRSQDDNLVEQNERVLRERISDVSDYEDMKERLQQHYLGNHQYEGSAFYMVFNEEYFKNVMASDEEVCGDGLKGNLDVAVAVRGDKLLDVKSVSSDVLIPAYKKKKNEQHVFYLMPLHYYQYNYGYLVFTDDPYVLKESMIYTYLEKMQQSLRLLRINLRLKQLYDKDSMTGLYNRFGYENKALPLYDESIKNGTRLTVLFVDINSMKRINDTYGHEQGDIAIKTVAASIEENLEKDWVAVRYGGDEFLVIVPNCGKQKAAGVKKRIEERIEEKKKENKLPYELTASIGYVTTDPKERPNADLWDYVREADALMYLIKKRIHGE